MLGLTPPGLRVLLPLVSMKQLSDPVIVMKSGKAASASVRLGKSCWNWSCSGVYEQDGEEILLERSHSNRGSLCMLTSDIFLDAPSSFPGCWRKWRLFDEMLERGVEVME